MTDLTPEEKQKIYLEEKARIEQQSRTQPAKKKSKTGYVALFVVAFLAILFYIQRDKLSLWSDLGSSKSPSSSVSAPPPPPSANFNLKVNKFTTDDYGYFEVVGEIKNTSATTYRFVQVKATFLNKAGVIVGDDTTYACAEDYILPGGTKSFKFMGENKPDYSSVRCSVVDCMEVK